MKFGMRNIHEHIYTFCMKYWLTLNNYKYDAGYFLEVTRGKFNIASLKLCTAVND
jgi:hypothetical protein